MTKKDYDIKLVTKWTPPVQDAYGEVDMRPLIVMPNLPKPTHGPGMQPRTILGTTTWNRMRKACYETAGLKCEICGAKVGVDIEKRYLHAHEVFQIDYEKGTSIFVRCVALCAKDHLSCIHNGRAITLFRQGNPLYPKEFLLDGAEKAFKMVQEYNKDHPEADLRCYTTYLDYLKCDELREEMEGLIEKYKVKFYEEDKKKMAKWKDWKVVVFGKEYPTPYKNEKEWKAAMEAANLTDTARVYATKKKKFEGLDSVEITEADLKKIEQAEVPEGF